MIKPKKDNEIHDYQIKHPYIRYTIKEKRERERQQYDASSSPPPDANRKSFIIATTACLRILLHRFSNIYCARERQRQRGDGSFSLHEQGKLTLQYLGGRQRQLQKEFTALTWQCPLRRQSSLQPRNMM